ncbi:MAG: hypothetical protein M1832_003976 [Thelocarpon impressellum]|nr:MAG: hypothetical protein M1832_003976 [Thelocarpon impressellum]
MHLARAILSPLVLALAASALALPRAAAPAAADVAALETRAAEALLPRFFFGGFGGRAKAPPAAPVETAASSPQDEIDRQKALDDILAATGPTTGR